MVFNPYHKSVFNANTSSTSANFLEPLATINNFECMVVRQLNLIYFLTTVDKNSSLGSMDCNWVDGLYILLHCVGLDVEEVEVEVRKDRA